MKAMSCNAGRTHPYAAARAILNQTDRENTCGAGGTAYRRFSRAEWPPEMIPQCEYALTNRKKERKTKNMSIIKKIAAFILAAALCLSGAALAEETASAAAEDCLGEWMECETQFAQMTIEKNPEEGWDVEIAAPLTHGAYIFRATIQYDEDQRCFTYNMGKFWDVPITEEENPELGEAKITGTIGTFTFAGDGENPVLIWADGSQPEKEVRFERAVGGDELTPADFLGEWTDLNGIRTINVTAREEGDGYLVEVKMDVVSETLEAGYLVWAYGCVWNEEARTLTSISRVTGNGRAVSDSKEEITDINLEYSDAVFYFKDGLLIWDDKNEGLDDGMVFQRTAGENEEPMPAEAAAFEGVWQCDRATIAMYGEEEGFNVLITWGSSAWEYTEWDYSCFYHDEDSTLVSMPFGTRTDLVYDENGDIASADEVYNDGEAVFSLDEEGKLIWQDQKENAGDGMRFEKIPQ